MSTAMTKSELSEAMTTLWDLLTSGNSDAEAMDMMGLSSDTYVDLKRRLVDEKAAELKNKPAEHIYVEYIIWQTMGIVDLTKMMGEFKRLKQYNAMVGAVRVRAELYDKLIAKGQEFGVFKKTPERKEIVAGMAISEMGNKELKGAITGAIGELGKLMKRYGDTKIIDIEPGPTHHGPALITSGDGVEVVPVAPRAKDDPEASPESIADREMAGIKASTALPKRGVTTAPTPGASKRPFKNAKAKTSKQSTAARGARPRDNRPKMKVNPLDWGD